MLYAWIECLATPTITKPAYASRAWYARQLLSSVPSIARALAQLEAANPMPYVVSMPGPQRESAADRYVTQPDSQYVQVPTFVLDLVRTGALSHKGFRFFAGVLATQRAHNQRRKKQRRGSLSMVTASTAELAAASGLAESAVARYRRECVAAGLLVEIAEGRGRSSGLLPLLRETTEGEREQISAEAHSACGQLLARHPRAPRERSTTSSDPERAGSRETETPHSRDTHARGSHTTLSLDALWKNALAVVPRLSEIVERDTARRALAARRAEFAAAEEADRPPCWVPYHAEPELPWRWRRSLTRQS